MRMSAYLPLAAAFAVALMLGCGGEGSPSVAPPEGETEVSAASKTAVPATSTKVKKYDLTDLPPVDEPLQRPLDGGRLEICPPADWGFFSQANYLVVFAKGKVSELPRMTVTAADSPYGTEDTTDENGEALAKKILQKLKKDNKNIREEPKKVILAENTWIRYVRQVPMGGTPCAVQSLQTVRGGRLYTLETFSAAKDDSQAAIAAAVKVKVDGSILRDVAYAVAANARFKDPGASPPKSEETPPAKAPETKPAEAPAETKPAETKPAEKPAEPKPEEKKTE